VPHHIERLSEYLAQQGWGCHVLSGGTSGTQVLPNGVTVHKPTFVRKLLGLVRQATNRRFHHWKQGGSLHRDHPGHWRRYRMYADVGQAIVRAHDIAVVASYNLLTYAPVGAYLSSKFRLPHVINVFGELHKYEAMVRNASFFRQVADPAFRLLSCSDHCGRSVGKAGIARPVSTVTYGINVEHFSPGADPAALRERHGLASDRVVLFVGRLGSEMGADSFLAAARLVSQRFSGVRFVLAGQVDDLAQRVRAECAASQGRFVAVTDVPYSELADYYRLASVVVVPTRGSRTCSSLAAMEAMATRKAVVGFAVGGVPEIVEHEKTGLLVQPESIDGLAGSIERLLSDDTLRDALAGRGYEQSGRRFDERQVNVTMERHLLDALDAT
jgi:glycosyltransferase involved in cell wall biosynthesis